MSGVDCRASRVIFPPADSDPYSLSGQRPSTTQFSKIEFQSR
jgi:hypothetical protein